MAVARQTSYAVLRMMPERPHGEWGLDADGKRPGLLRLTYPQSRLYSYGLCSHGLQSYGLCSYV